ncbi:MAG: hypothetical protein PHE27_06930 [Alphaproteobacteria bacterium]|nr:hypothetical protein [Alphaproteobacteria bacterium]
MSRVFAVLCLILAALPAQAGQVEARDVARLNNCPPKKIDVVRSFPGSSGRTIYRVSCTLPKATDQVAGAADAILIDCEQSLCSLIRPVSSEKN